MLERNTTLNKFDPSVGRGLNRYRWSRKATRFDLPRNLGRGYTDTYALPGDLLVKVSDVTYSRDTWIGIEEQRPLQIRILLSGEIRSPTEGVSPQAMGAMICIIAGGEPARMFISANRPYQSVVLECNLELLTQVIGLSAQEIPAPIDRLMKPNGTSVSNGVRCGPECFRVAREMLASRHVVPQELRTQYIEYAAMSILCGVLTALTHKSRGGSPAD